MQKALQVLMHGRTTFIIAHRLSTVRKCDLILVFQHGRIVERGRFDELVRRGGIFAELVGSQLGGEEEAHADGGSPTDVRSSRSDAAGRTPA